MIYSAYKLNKQCDNIQPRCTSFPIWNQSIVPCLVLTVASWPHTCFLGGRKGGLVVPSLSEFSSLLWSTESKASLHSQWSRNMYFSGILLLFLWSKDVGNLIYGSSAFSKTSLNIWKLLVHILLKPSLKDFEYYLATCEMSAIVWLSILWHCLSLGLEWKLTFSSPVATAEFSKSVGMLSAAL